MKTQNWEFLLLKFLITAFEIEIICLKLQILYLLSRNLVLLFAKFFTEKSKCRDFSLEISYFEVVISISQPQTQLRRLGGEILCVKTKFFVQNLQFSF